MIRVDNKNSDDGESRAKGKTRNRMYLIISIIILAYPVFTGVVTLNNFRISRGNNYFFCRSNLKILGTAIEMYKTDNNKYPSFLNELTPDYLKNIPCCPENLNKYYVYHTYLDEKGEYQFVVYCQGNNHSLKEKKPDYPQFRSVGGLIGGTD
ncbi:MAG: type II secretion system protein [Vulcanimicrobiota bacterium]